MAVASVGNIIGSCFNWWIGQELLRFQSKPWFPFENEQIKTAQYHFNRFGVWMLLFAWVPIIGDPLTLIAGMLKVRFPLFLLFVSHSFFLVPRVLTRLFVRHIQLQPSFYRVTAVTFLHIRVD